MCSPSALVVSPFWDFLPLDLFLPATSPSGKVSWTRGGGCAPGCPSRGNVPLPRRSLAGRSEASRQDGGRQPQAWETWHAVAQGRYAPTRSAPCRSSITFCGSDIENAVIISTLIASSAAGGVVVLLRAVSFERLVSFPHLLQGSAYLNRLLPCFLRLRRPFW